MYTGFMDIGPAQGWQCPSCRAINAPFVTQCPCSGRQAYTITSTGTSTFDFDKLNIKGAQESTLRKCECESCKKERGELP